jgi:uncharacterized protein (DUF433 family)
VLHWHPCTVQTLVEFFETGETIDTFLATYPYIPREQAYAFLELSHVG